MVLANPSYEACFWAPLFTFQGARPSGRFDLERLIRGRQAQAVCGYVHSLNAKAPAQTAAAAAAAAAAATAAATSSYRAAATWAAAPTANCGATAATTVHAHHAAPTAVTGWLGAAAGA